MSDIWIGGSVKDTIRVGSPESLKFENAALLAENQRLREELAEMYRILGITEEKALDDTPAE